jgi:SNF2 family DNA or RNA helicase
LSRQESISKFLYNFSLDSDLQRDKSFDDFISKISNWQEVNATIKNVDNNVFEGRLSDVFSRQLKSFQLENVISLLRYNVGATFSVPGAGKTTEILSLFSYLKTNEPDLKLLVVSPLNAFSAWDEEIPLCLKYSDTINNEIYSKTGEYFKGKMSKLNGGKENINFILDQNPNFLIVSYQTLINNVDQIAEFCSINNIFCALDESHRVKNINGKTTSATLKLSTVCNFRYIMSGTPMPQDQSDLISQYKFLYPYEYADADKSYKNIQNIYVRTTKSKLGLTPQNVINVNVEMNSPQRELYQNIKNIFKNEMLNVTDKVQLIKLKSCVMRLLQISSNPMIIDHDPEFNKLVDNLGLEANLNEFSSKFNKTVELAKKITSSGRKVIIWTGFKRNIDFLTYELSDLNPVVIDGRSSTGDEFEKGSRKNNIARFKTDKDCMVFIANPAAASEGISLHIDYNKEFLCGDAIYMDRNFNCSQYLQSIDRIHRIGCIGTPNIYILKTTNSIDERVQDRINMKIDNLKELLDDISLYPQNVDDIIDLSLIDNQIEVSDIEKQVNQKEIDLLRSYIID